MVLDNSSDFIYQSLIYMTMAMVGACMGSFSSAIAHRTATGASWISTFDSLVGRSRAVRSQCPLCHHQLAWFDLIPIFSWIMAFGVCRYCHGHISWRYPLVEILGAVLACLFLVMGAGGLFLVGGIVGLPFLLAFVWLCGMRIVPPLYMWGIVLGVVAVVFYVFFEGKSI